MGTEISEEDVGNIGALCDQVIQLADYRLVMVGQRGPCPCTCSPVLSHACVL